MAESTFSSGFGLPLHWFLREKTNFNLYRSLCVCMSAPICDHLPIPISIPLHLIYFIAHSSFSIFKLCQCPHLRLCLLRITWEPPSEQNMASLLKQEPSVLVRNSKQSPEARLAGASQMSSDHAHNWPLKPKIETCSVIINNNEAIILASSSTTSLRDNQTL